MRRAAKRDDNEPDIVGALEKAGARVWRHLPVDLLVWFRGRFHLMEVKKPEWKKPRKDQAEQTKFLQETGTRVVKSAEDALRAIGAI